MTAKELREKAEQFRVESERLKARSIELLAVADILEKLPEGYTVTSTLGIVSSKLSTNSPRIQELVDLLSVNGPMRYGEIVSKGFPRGSISKLLNTPNTFYKTSDGKWDIRS